MTGKMTNTIKLSYITLGLPYLSFLIHLNLCLNAEWGLHLEPGWGKSPFEDEGHFKYCYKEDRNNLTTLVLYILRMMAIFPKGYNVTVKCNDSFGLLVSAMMIEWSSPF